MNVVQNTDQRPDDERERSSAAPTGSPPISVQGDTSPAIQQEAENSQLSDLTIAAPQADHEIIEVERRVHAIAQRLIEYLNIEGIDPSSYPKVERVDSRALSSYYRASTNVIGLMSEDLINGFAIGEEVAHWLHSQCLSMQPPATEDDSRLSTTTWLNGLEFVGYIGRELARRACIDSELSVFFDPSSKEAPQSVKEFRRSRTEAESTLEKLKRAVGSPEIKKAGTLIDTCKMALEAGSQACDDLGESSEDVNCDSVREILLATYQEAAAPLDQAIKVLEGSRFKEVFEKLPWFTGLQDRRKFLNNIAKILLDKLSKHEELFEEVEENRAEALNLFFRRVLSDWSHVLSRTHINLLMAEPDCPMFTARLILTKDSQVNHYPGYEGGAVWLERTSDIRKNGAELFYLFPPQLYAKYVKPVCMSSFERGIYAIAKSAMAFLSFLSGGVKREG